LRLLYTEREKIIAAINDFGPTAENKRFLPKQVFMHTEGINKKTLAFLKKLSLV
jgi:hypothetical protein